MKSIFPLIGILCAAIPSYAETVKCYIGDYTWTESTYTLASGSYSLSGTYSETHSIPDADSGETTGNIKAGYKSGDGECFYYNSVLYYDLSSLYNLGEIRITNAQIVVYVSEMDATITDASTYSTLSHVLDGNTTSIGTSESATVGQLNYIDITSLVAADYAAAVTSSSYTLTSASIVAGTTGTNYTKLSLHNSAYGTDNQASSYIEITYEAVPEPTVLVLLGSIAIGWVFWKKQKA